MADAPSPEVLRRLVENHRQFLGFLEKKVGDRALAEDLLQEAFVRGVTHGGSVRDDESAVAWFYRLLRNTVIDHARRRTSAARRLESFAHELDAERDDDTRAAVCQCVGSLASTLKPEYADALQRVEVEGMAVKDYAERVGISASNAGVRLFRAREALRSQVTRSCGACATHGCLDCSCGPK